MKSSENKKKRESREPQLRITYGVGLKRWQWLKDQEKSGRPMNAVIDEALDKVFPLK